MTVRMPAVAGVFYPGEPAQLREMLSRLLAKVPESDRQPLAFVAPHAGYVYSGLTAAHAYRTLGKHGGKRRVFLLGPSHRVYLKGASVGPWSSFRTPLGDVPLDLEVVNQMADRESVISRDPAPHRQEHSLEVHLPFLQVTLGNFSLVPLVYGNMESAELAALVRRYWQPGDLLIGSSDLSHFYTDEAARRIDANCHQAMLSRSVSAMDQCEACGNGAMKTLLHLAAGWNWSVALADYRTSADTAGERSRVVGYASYLFYGEPPTSADGAGT